MEYSIQKIKSKEKTCFCKKLLNIFIYNAIYLNWILNNMRGVQHYFILFNEKKHYCILINEKKLDFPFCHFLSVPYKNAYSNIICIYSSVLVQNFKQSSNEIIYHCKWVNWRPTLHSPTPLSPLSPRLSAKTGIYSMHGFNSSRLSYMQYTMFQ